MASAVVLLTACEKEGFTDATDKGARNVSASRIGGQTYTNTDGDPMEGDRVTERTTATDVWLSYNNGAFCFQLATATARIVGDYFQIDYITEDGRDVVRLDSIARTNTDGGRALLTYYADGVQMLSIHGRVTGAGVVNLVPSLEFHADGGDVALTRGDPEQ